MPQPANSSANTTHHPRVTIDILAHIFYTTILHPFPVILFLLCLRAVAYEYDSTHFISASVYLVFVILLRFFFIVDARIGEGKPRNLEWKDEVVLITGGAGGLGSTIAEVFGLRGVGVAVVDVKAESEAAAEWEAKGCAYYQCDVGDREQVRKLKERVERDLGVPTILINNAALVNGKTLLDLTEDMIEKNYRVNLLSHIYTIQTFLPGMLARPNGGTIVTISSVLGYLGCAKLADYTSAKAALTALHHSLTAELGLMRPSGSKQNASQMRTLLVTPGQLSTPLFTKISPPSNFLGPVVPVSEIATKVVAAIDTGKSGEIAMPLYARWIGWMGVLPLGLRSLARRMAGLDRASWDGFELERKKER